MTMGMMIVKNPRSNAILERVHAVINNHLRFLRTLDPKQMMQDSDPWENILMSVTFAINSAAHATTQMMPGQLVFGRDVILHTKHVANWEHMRLHKQNRIDYDDNLENKSRIAHDYEIGDRVFILKNMLLKKNDPDREGPHTIVDVHANGTVDTRRGAIVHPVNVRRLVPHF